MQQPPLSNDEALRALQQGATILALDVPEGTEFGVDLRTYSVGAKFRGMKMVPPGLHLVLCGNEIAKSGAFVPSASPDGWQQAAELGFERARQTLRGITGMKVLDEKARVEDGVIVEYLVTLQVVFLLEEAPAGED